MADDLIESLKAQLASKDREISKLTGEATKYRHRNKELRGQVEALTGDREGLIKERDGFRTKAESNPDKSAAELEQLRGEVRSYKHRDGMSQLAYAPDVGVNPSIPVAHLMTLIGYAADSDEFDAKQARQKLVAAKDTHQYLFAPAGGTGQHHAPGLGGAALSPGVAAMGSAMGRGSTPNPTGAPGDLTEEHMRDPVFMSDYNRRMRTGK